MPARVNPEPGTKEFLPAQRDTIIAVLDTIDQLIVTVGDLRNFGFADESVSVFVGEAGVNKLEQEHRGVFGGIIRVLESLAVDEKVKEEAKNALRSGHILISVATDGSEEQKSAVRRILMAHNARDFRLLGQWTVQHL